MASNRSVEKLTQIPICQGLSPEEREAIGAITEEAAVPQGELVFAEGQPGDALYVILAGQVDIAKKDKSGKERQLARLDDGAVFGEMSLIDGHALRSATARATAPATLLRIPTAKFQKLLQGDHTGALKMVRNVAQVLTRRILLMNEKILENEKLRELLEQDEGKGRHKKELDEFQKLLKDWSF